MGSIAVFNYFGGRMVSIIIATHGESAPALLDSTTMILGEVENVHID